MSGLGFDLRMLEVFLAVCETGGMSMAARRLGITQPAVSQLVAELEARGGVLLLDRSVRPLALTPAGTLLRQRAATLLAEAHRIGPLLHQAQQGRLPLLRVGLVDSLSRALAGPLARFLADVAEQSSVYSGLTAAHARALLTRELDLFLGADDLAEVEGLEREPLLEEDYILLCPPGIVAPDRPEAIATLAATLPLLRFSARSRTGLEIERHLRRLRLDIPRRQEFDTPHALTAAVAAGLGFAISTPLCLAEAALPQAGLQMAPLPGPRFSRRLVLIARQRELGPLPRQLAAMARGVLSASV